jgi:hypothetical protein
MAAYINKDGPALKVGAPHLHLSHEDHQHRVEQLVHDNTRNPEDARKYWGCHGEPIFSRLLPFVDLSTFFLVPIAHAMLYGVIPSFVSYALRPVPKPGKVGMVKLF